MIEIKDLNFSQVEDPIKTEETIYFQIRDLSLKIPYVAFPIAYSINTLGIEKTQQILNRINLDYPFKKFFVCQHISVNKLNFGENLVFTPHTEKGDSYFFIPHYNPIYKNPPKVKKIKNRKIDFSFVGDFNTSLDRVKLSSFNYPESIIKPTGKWFFSCDQKSRESLLSYYIETLEDTKISMCPRGTGPSTLRLFESMSVGSIPVIFNDLDIPEILQSLVIKVDLDRFVLGDYTEEILSKNLQEISDGIYEVYWSNFSNSNLSKSILKSINNEH